MSDRLLAEAWRDLAGDAVGMVWRVPKTWRPGEHLVVTPADGVCSLDELLGDAAVPALDSRANWGHWIDFVHHKVGELEIELAADYSVACSYDMDTAHADESLPLALLESFCSHMDNMVKHGLEESRPPSVLAWWKSQQGEVSGG